MVWYDQRDGNQEIYYKRSVNNGLDWSSDVRLTDDPAASRNPSIAVRNSVVHVVWTDSRDGNYEIYYKRSDNNGINWNSDERLTYASETSSYPSVACWDCPYDVHVAWTDGRNGNLEIYYKRHKCEGGSVEESQKLEVALRVESFFAIGGAKFSIYLRCSSLIELKVFDVSGRLVDKREWALSEGKHQLTWHNERSGLYFFKFKIDGTERVRKAIIF